MFLNAPLYQNSFILIKFLRDNIIL